MTASVTVVDITDQSPDRAGGRPNQQVAKQLREAAELLEQQQANPFRVNAYRRAAETVAGLDEDLAALLEREGIESLDALPGIGSVLAQAIAQMVRTGRWAQLERLRGAVAPEQLFQSIPGVGPDLAQRVHEHLDVDTLEALELAAHDGRLEQVPGIGPRRAAMLRATLAGMLARTRPTRRHRAIEPRVDLLLDVDREYREKAERGALPRLAPRRFNPTGEGWLPILHTERGDWHFTALFSNTALAHELGRVRDWVVIYFHQDSGPEGQRTVPRQSSKVSTASSYLNEHVPVNLQRMSADLIELKATAAPRRCEVCERRAPALGAHRLERTRSGDQPPLTGIFFSFALTSGGLGKVTVSTPLAKEALT